MSSKCFFRDDRAQATTEYILILAIAVSIFILAYLNFIRPFFGQFEQIVLDTLTSKMFPADFHHFPIHR